MLTLADTLGNILKITASSSHFVALFIGPPGSGKSVICEQLAYNYLSGGQKVIYMATERSPSQILERMKRFGWDVRKFVGEKLRFADLYSWQLDGNQRSEENERGFRVCPLNATDLQLSTRPIQEHAEDGGRVVFDSLTTLTSLIGEKQATGFVQTLNARIRESAAGLAVLTSGVHSEGFQIHMHSCYDLIFELTFQVKDKVQRYLRIEKFAEGEHPAEWIPFTITDKGIVIGNDPSSRLWRDPRSP